MSINVEPWGGGGIKERDSYSAIVLSLVSTQTERVTLCPKFAT